MKRLKQVLRDSTTMAALPQFKSVPLKLTKGKKDFLPAKRIKLSDVLDRYELIVKGRHED